MGPGQWMSAWLHELQVPLNERLAAWAPGPIETMAQFQWDLHIVCNVVDIACMVEQIAELYA